MMITPALAGISLLTALPVMGEAEVAEFSLEDATVETEISVELEAEVEVEEPTEEPLAPPAPVLPETAPPSWWMVPPPEAALELPVELPAEAIVVPDGEVPVVERQTAGAPPSWWAAPEAEPMAEPEPESEVTVASVTVPQIDQPAAIEQPVLDLSQPEPLLDRAPEPPPIPRDAVQAVDAPTDKAPPPADQLPRRAVAPIMHAVAEAAGQPPTPEAGDDLGRLQVMLHRDGEHMHITITAERPETLEMMRRHADQLQLELQQEGFSQTDLSFTEWDQPEEDAEESAPSTAPEPVIFNLPAPMATSGLDIRM